MQKIILLLSTLFLTVQVSFTQQKDEWLTFYERSNFLETPNYENSIKYFKKLADSSPFVNYFSFGKSHEGRDLPALTVSTEKNFSPTLQKRSKKALIMVQCGIHAGEIDGKDAMMLLIRDIVIENKYPGILDHINLLVVPIFNVDGHEKISPYNRINQNGPKEMGWRVNALNLNLNRDYLKAEATEMKHWIRLFNEWMPDFFIDSHVSDGADWPYTAMYETEKNQNINKGIADWTKEHFLPYVLSECEKAGHPIIPYVGFVDEFDITKGINSGVMPPKLSTGYTAARNRQGFLIETHSYKDYKTRVDATYQICRVIFQLLNKEYARLKKLNREADLETSRLFYYTQSFPLSFKNDNKYVETDFRIYKMIREKSFISGVDKRYYDNSKEESYKIPYYNSVEPSVSVKPPFGFVIPKQWSQFADIIKLHGAQVYTFSEDQKIKVTSYKMTDPKWRERPYEGRHLVNYKPEPVELEVMVKKGSYFVPVNQQQAKVIIYLLEATSNESFAAWGYLDAVFEQKEYAEQYVLERYAMQMYNENEKIRNEFDLKIKEDSAFSASPQARLNYFYKKLPYYDNNIGVYPIYRVETEERLKINKK